MATHARPKDRYSADKFDTGLLAGIAVKTFWGLDLANMSPMILPRTSKPWRGLPVAIPQADRLIGAAECRKHGPGGSVSVTVGESNITNTRNLAK